MSVKYGDVWFWDIEEFRQSFYESFICFSIDRFFSYFDDECFLTKQILHPFDGFFPTTWFDMDGVFHVTSIEKF